MARSLSPNILPEGWQYDLLDSFTKRCSGHTPSKSHPEYWDGGIKWISLSDTYRLDKGYVYETEKEISLEGTKNSSAEIHPAETVVLSRDAGIGKSGVMAEPMAVSQHFIAWKCDNQNTMHSWFLYNWLQLHKKEFERQAVGSTIKTIGLPYFKKLKIALPPFREQEKIAKILSTWDKAIAAVEKLIVNSQQQKKALMQQLLTGKKRLPGFEGEWEVVKLDVLLKEKKRKGKIVPTNDNAKGVPYIGSTSFEGGFGIYTESDDAVLCDDADILILWDGENAGKSATGLRGAVSSTVVRLRLNQKKADSVFINNYLIRDNYKIREIREGSGIPHMPGDFEHWYEIKAPSVEEQKAISKVLTMADKNISVLIKQLEQLKQEKKSLMQQLLTGKRRVKAEAA